MRRNPRLRWQAMPMHRHARHHYKLCRHKIRPLCRFHMYDPIVHLGDRYQPGFGAYCNSISSSLSKKCLLWGIGIDCCDCHRYDACQIQQDQREVGPTKALVLGLHWLLVMSALQRFIVKRMPRRMEVHPTELGEKGRENQPVPQRKTSRIQCLKNNRGCEGLLLAAQLKPQGSQESHLKWLKV